jgi:Uma2 family endonuclease
MATVNLRIGPTDNGRRMTLEEFQEAEEQPGFLYELARGVLEVTEVPGDDHGQIVDNLHEALSEYRREHPGLIRRIGHGSDIRLILPELELDRHPDLAVVFRNFTRMYRDRQRPDLVIEVVSHGRRAKIRDYEEKREEYLDLGIREYWIVDPEERQVTILNRTEDQGQVSWSECIFAGVELIKSALLPGFQAAVSDLWFDLNQNEE